MTRREKEALTLAHRARQNALRERVAGVLGGLLARMETLDEDELRAYHAAALPVLTGGQHASADVAAGYATAVAPARDRTIPVDVAAALMLSGVLVTEDSRSLVAPVLRARRLVAEGEQVSAAIGAASDYAALLSSGDLQAAQRVGVEQGALSSGSRVVGYRKEPSGDACEWCQTVSGRVYRSADAVPFHTNDRCAVAPVFAGE